jgi:flagellar motility protein MotE (MotC chaperone)
VLEATEKRIADKITEMKALDAQLNRVVAQYNQHQNAEIMSLVKIYENMKPGDAAAIFNELDMPILLEVIDKMSERKVAPVLAKMDPKRARDVTQELAELRRGQPGIGTPAPTAN